MIRLTSNLFFVLSKSNFQKVNAHFIFSDKRSINRFGMEKFPAEYLIIYYILPTFSAFRPLDRVMTQSLPRQSSFFLNVIRFLHIISSSKLSHFVLVMSCIPESVILLSSQLMRMYLSTKLLDEEITNCKFFESTYR